MNEIVVAATVGTGIGLVGKIVFDWLKNKNGNGKTVKFIKCPLDKAEVIAKIDWLKEVHNIKDSDGVPLWYVPRSLEEIMTKVVDITQKQNEHLIDIKSQLSVNGDKLEVIIENGRN